MNPIKIKIQNNAFNISKARNKFSKILTKYMDKANRNHQKSTDLMHYENQKNTLKKTSWSKARQISFDKLIENLGGE